MALFQPIGVTLGLEKLSINTSDDRWWDVEPYVVPIFFKVDGERYLASLRIFHSQQPRDGSGEQPTSLAGGEVQLSLDTVETGTWPTDPVPDIHEDNPFIYVPPQDLLGRGSFDDGDNVNLQDVALSTTLYPIPLRIDVAGTYMTATEAVEGLFVPIEGAIHDAINLVFLKLDDFIGGLFGLDEMLESCPTDLGSSDFLKDIDAQFNAMIPGTVGGVFVLMENDAFDEDLAEDLQSSIRDEVAHVINHVVNGINQTNFIADVDRVLDGMDVAGDIQDDMFWPALGDIGISVGAIGLSIGAFVLGSLVIGIPLALYGIINLLSWIAGGPDDRIGVLNVKFDHSDLLGLGAGAALEGSATDPEGDEDNNWTLHYSLKVNSVG